MVGGYTRTKEAEELLKLYESSVSVEPSSTEEGGGVFRQENKERRRIPTMVIERHSGFFDTCSQSSSQGSFHPNLLPKFELRAGFESLRSLANNNMMTSDEDVRKTYYHSASPGPDCSSRRRNVFHSQELKRMEKEQELLKENLLLKSAEIRVLKRKVSVLQQVLNYKRTGKVRDSPCEALSARLVMKESSVANRKGDSTASVKSEPITRTLIDKTTNTAEESIQETTYSDKGVLTETFPEEDKLLEGWQEEGEEEEEEGDEEGEVEGEGEKLEPACLLAMHSACILGLCSMFAWFWAAVSGPWHDP